MKKKILIGILILCLTFSIGCANKKPTPNPVTLLDRLTALESITSSNTSDIATLKSAKLPDSDLTFTQDAKGIHVSLPVGTKKIALKVYINFTNPVPLGQDYVQGLNKCYSSQLISRQYTPNLMYNGQLFCNYVSFLVYPIQLSSTKGTTDILFTSNYPYTTCLDVMVD